MPPFAATCRSLCAGRWRLAVCIALAFCALAAQSGCQMFRPREPVAKPVAEARQLSQRGLSAMERGDYASAETLLGDAVKTCPQDLDARRQYAEALWQRNDREQALEQVVKALLQSPDDAQLAIRAGEMQLAMGRLDDARRMADQVLDQNPAEPRAWTLRGRIFQSLGDSDRALADYHRALEFRRDDRDTLLATAELYRTLNKPQRALATLMRLRETYGPLEEPQQVLYLQGLALVALSRNDDAGDCFALALERGPANTELLYRYAEAQLATGKRIEADRTLEQALALDPTHGPSRALRQHIDLAARPMDRFYP